MQSPGLTPRFWRYFTLLFGGMALAIAAFSYAFYQEEVTNKRQQSITRDMHHVEIQQAILVDALASAFDALSFIGDQVRQHRPFSDPDGRRRLGKEFVSFLKSMPGFDKVRLIDLQGHEFIRVNNRIRPGPRLIPAAGLQDKSGRYYFIDATHLARGQMYLSALDLNMEHGEVERPLKPMIRLAMLAFEGNRKAGVVVLNLKMGKVLERFQQVNHADESEAYLLSQDGYFLSSPHAGWNWGFMLAERHNQRFAALFPKAWQHISGRGRGQIEAGGNLFTFVTFDLLKALNGLPDHPVKAVAGHHRYIIVSRFSGMALTRLMAHERRLFLTGSTLLTLAASLFAWKLAQLHTRQVQARELLATSRRKLAHVMSTTPAVHYACLVKGECFTPTFASPNLKGLFGWDPDAVIGDAEWWGLNLHPEDRDRVVEGLHAALGEGRGNYVHEYRFRHTGDHYLWVHDELTIEHDAGGRPVEIVGSWLDITERKKAEEMIESSLKEKEVLLREVHHRVKNNMQIISSLLKLQAAQVKNAQLQALYRDSQNRIHTMSLVHEQLYASESLNTIRSHAYLENIVASLVKSSSVPAQNIAVRVDTGDVALSMDEAVPCGLIINELVTNALKYAFPEGNGEITVSLTIPDKEHRLLRVHDNGCGLPPGMDIHAAETLGLQLVDTLATQLDGELTINCERGTDIRILFPAGKEENA